MTQKATRIPTGICGFVKRDYLDLVSIGFAILPEFEGNDYTYEAAKATLKYGKTQLLMGMVFGITTSSNIVSQHLLEKLVLKFLHRRVDTTQDKELLVFSNQIEMPAVEKI